MKPVANKNFELNDVFYDKGEEVEINDIDTLVRLNEKGFVGPFTPKQIQDFFKKPVVKNIFKKEEE